jgi:hypothetical protein
MSSPPIIIEGRVTAIRDGIIVLASNAYIMVPPGVSMAGIRVGDRVSVTVRSEGGRWFAEKVEREAG